MALNETIQISGPTISFTQIRRPKLSFTFGDWASVVRRIILSFLGRNIHKSKERVSLLRVQGLPGRSKMLRTKSKMHLSTPVLVLPDMAAWQHTPNGNVKMPNGCCFSLAYYPSVFVPELPMEARYIFDVVTLSQPHISFLRVKWEQISCVWSLAKGDMWWMEDFLGLVEAYTAGGVGRYVRLLIQMKSTPLPATIYKERRTEGRADLLHTSCIQSRALKSM